MVKSDRKILSLKYFRYFLFCLTGCLFVSLELYADNVLPEGISTGFFISPQFSPDESKVEAIVYGVKGRNQGRIIHIMEPFVDLVSSNTNSLEKILMVEPTGAYPSAYPLDSKIPALKKFWDVKQNDHVQAWLFSGDNNNDTLDASLDLNNRTITGERKAYFRSRQMDADGVGFHCYLPDKKLHIQSQAHVRIRNKDPMRDENATDCDIEITGEEMDIDLQNNIATILRHVRVLISERHEEITCNKMIVHMGKDGGFETLFGSADDEPDLSKKEDARNSHNNSIQKIEFIENVVYQKKDTSPFQAFADFIVYDGMKKQISLNHDVNKNVRIVSDKDIMDCDSLLIQNVNIVNGNENEQNRENMSLHAVKPIMHIQNVNISPSASQGVEDLPLDANSSSMMIEAESLVYSQKNSIAVFNKSVEAISSNDENIFCDEMEIHFSGTNSFSSVFQGFNPEDNSDIPNKNPDKNNNISKIICRSDVVFVSHDIKISGDRATYTPASEDSSAKNIPAKVIVTCDSGKREVHCNQYQVNTTHIQNILDCSQISILFQDGNQLVNAQNALIDFIADNDNTDSASHDSMSNPLSEKKKVPLQIDAPVMDMVLGKQNELKSVKFMKHEKRQVETIVKDNGTKVLCDTMTVFPVTSEQGKQELSGIQCDNNVVYTKPMPDGKTIIEKVTADHASYQKNKPMTMTADIGQKVYYNNYQDNIQTVSDEIIYDVATEHIRLINTHDKSARSLVCNFGNHKSLSDELTFSKKDNTVSGTNIFIQFDKTEKDKSSQSSGQIAEIDYCNIEADSMEYLEKNNTIVFLGNVKTQNLRNSQDSLLCENMEILLDQTESEPPVSNLESKNNSVRFSLGSRNAKQVTCLGSPTRQVIYNSPKISDDSFGHAVNTKSDEAIYDVATQCLTMKGNGYFKQDDITNHFEEAVYNMETEIFRTHDNETTIKNK